MKKKVFVLSALALFSLVGCTARGYSSSTGSNDSDSSSSNPTNNSSVISSVKDGIRVAYGIVSGNIVRGEIQIRNSVASKVHFDEVKFESDYTGAIASSVTSGENVISGNVTSWGSTSMKYRAKYITVNGKVWTGSYVAKDDKNGSFVYKNGDDEFNAYYGALTSQADMAEFYYALVNNFVYASDKDGNKDTTIAVNQYSKASADTNYWLTDVAEKTIEGSQWKWNVQLLERQLEGKNLNNEITVNKLSRVTVGEDKKESNSYTWVVDGVDTGATMTTYSWYVDLAKKAFSGESHIAAAYSADKSRDTDGGNQAYIAKVELVCDENNKVVKSFLNETSSFIGGIAKAKDTSAEYATVDYTKKASWGGTADSGTIAKYMYIDGTIWEADPINDADYSYFDPAVWNTKNTTLDAHTYYGDDAYLACDYFNAAFLHEIKVSSDEKGTNLYPVDFGTDKVTATKAEYGCAYWTYGVKEEKAINGSQWKWNIKQIEDSFVDVDFTSPVKMQDDADKGWKLNDEVTGATMVEFPSWVRIALMAGSYLVK